MAKPGESRGVRDLQRGTDTLVAARVVVQRRARPVYTKRRGGPKGEEEEEKEEVRDRGQQRGRVENALTASGPSAGSLAVSRDNWDTVYYRLRAIRGARCVIG